MGRRTMTDQKTKRLVHDAWFMAHHAERLMAQAADTDNDLSFDDQCACREDAHRYMSEVKKILQARLSFWLADGIRRLERQQLSTNEKALVKPPQ